MPVSSHKGGTRSRAPAHQNVYAFRHNPKSKKSDKIMAMPNKGLCPRCHDQIEWRKKYRKYKPLKAARTCTACGKKEVKAAYHVHCMPCAEMKIACPKCLKSHNPIEADEGPSIEEQIRMLEDGTSGLRERERRSQLRKLRRELEGGDGEEGDEDGESGEDSEDEEGQEVAGGGGGGAVAAATAPDTSGKDSEHDASAAVT